VQGTPPALPIHGTFGHLLPSGIGLGHEIQASTDLAHWVTLTNLNFYFQDPDSTNFERRFYRFLPR